MTHHTTLRRARLAVAAGSVLLMGVLAVPLSFAAGPGTGAPAAPYTLQGDTNNTGTGNTTFSSPGHWVFTSTTEVGLIGWSPTQGVQGNATGDPTLNFVSGVTGLSTGTGVYGEAYGNYAGLYGQSDGADGAGVVAFANGFLGAYAESDGGGGQGLYAFTAGDGGYGVVGDATGGTVGGVGVWGESYQSSGVVGTTNGSAAGAPNITAAVTAWNFNLNGGNLFNNAGVYAYCYYCNAIYGVSQSNTGVLGWGYTSIGTYGYSGDGTGVFAESERSTALAARQKNPQPGRYAGAFYGDVGINGALAVTGAMGVMVNTNSGTRQVYGSQATTNVVSDQGTATLSNGRVVVSIDSLFAQTVNLGAGYHVYLTPRSFDSKGLAVGNLTGTSFEVREINGGTGSYSFDWRIEATRKGYEAARMGTVIGLPTSPATPFNPALVVPSKSGLIGGAQRPMPPMAMPGKPHVPPPPHK